MVSNYYSQDCDEYNNQNFKQKHLKSIAHLHIYYNIITNKYNIGDVYWSDIETIIHEYIKDNSTKFYAFTILLRGKLNNEDINISVDGDKGCVPLYKFEDGTCFIINIVKVNKYEIISSIVLC